MPHCSRQRGEAGWWWPHWRSWASGGGSFHGQPWQSGWAGRTGSVDATGLRQQIKTVSFFPSTARWKKASSWGSTWQGPGWGEIASFWRCVERQGGDDLSEQISIHELQCISRGVGGNVKNSQMAEGWRLNGDWFDLQYASLYTT